MLHAQKNSWTIDSGTLCNAGQVFNFDAFNLALNPEQKAFILSLPVGGEYMPIPEKLLDNTTAQNFDCEVRLTVPADFEPVEIWDI